MLTYRWPLSANISSISRDFARINAHRSFSIDVSEIVVVITEITYCSFSLRFFFFGIRSTDNQLDKRWAHRCPRCDNPSPVYRHVIPETISTSERSTIAGITQRGRLSASNLSKNISLEADAMMPSHHHPVHIEGGARGTRVVNAARCCFDGVQQKPSPGPAFR